MWTVGDVMTDKLVTVGVDKTLGEVARALRRHDVGSAIVVDESAKPLGIITERDLVESVAASRNPDQGQARSWMSEDLVTVDRTTALDEARRLMTLHAIRHLPVTDGGAIVGVISIRDLIGER